MFKYDNSIDFLVGNKIKKKNQQNISKMLMYADKLYQFNMFIQFLLLFVIYKQC